MQLLKDFKTFAVKGNVVDLAIGIIIGTAFGKIVTSLVNDLIMPLFGLILGRFNLSGAKYVIDAKNSKVGELAIRYGAFLQSILDFVIVAFSIFIIIRLFTAFKKKQEEIAEEIIPIPSRQEILLEEIRDLLKKKKKINEKYFH